MRQGGIVDAGGESSGSEDDAGDDRSAGSARSALLVRKVESKESRGKQKKSRTTPESGQQALGVVADKSHEAPAAVLSVNPRAPPASSTTTSSSSSFPAACSMALPPPRPSLESLPDAVLLRIVEMLGSPPPLPSSPESISHVRKSWFVSDLTSMMQVSRRWLGVVSSSDVWREVVLGLWPAFWYSKPAGLPSSPSWREACVRLGRCVERWDVAGPQPDGYIMMYDISTEDNCCKEGRRFISGSGPLIVRSRVAGAGMLLGADAVKMTWLEALQHGDGEEGGDPVKAVCQRPFSINVVLYDKKTGKMASFYRAHEIRFGQVAASSPGNSKMIATETGRLVTAKSLHPAFYQSARIVRTPSTWQFYLIVLASPNSHLDTHTNRHHMGGPPTSAVVAGMGVTGMQASSSK